MISMHGLRHIIWDFNGTLFNDVALCIDLLADSCRSHGVPCVDMERFRALFCQPVATFYRRIGFRLDDKAFETLSHEFHARYEARLEECALYEGALELLALFGRLGMTQSILSALPHDILESLVEKYEIGCFFSHIGGASDRLAGSKVGAAKAWMKSHHVLSRDMLMIGDTLHDAEVAQALGVRCLLVAQGFQSRSVLEQSGEMVAGSLREVWDALRSPQELG